MDIHERIQQLINKEGWSLYKLSQETGIHETTVYNWFNENHFTPSRKSIEIVCATLNISITQFYSEIDIDESELNEEQILLLELFEKIPKNKRQVVFDILRNLTDKS